MGIITPRRLSNWGLTVEGVVAERRRLGAAAESRSPFEKHLVEALLTTTIYVGSSRRVPSELKNPRKSDIIGKIDFVDIFDQIGYSCVKLNV